MRSAFELGLAASMGAAAVVLMYVAAPATQTQEDCKVYKVAPKAVISYVLRPPPAPPTEIKQCPVVQAPKCEPVAQETETTNKDDARPRRRYRHHRIRRYWR